MSEQKNKFETMLEKLVADDRQSAEELFHEIVVEKSREIYENILEGDLDDAKVEEKAKKDDSKKDKSVEEKADTSEKEEDTVEETTDEAEEKAEESAEIPADLEISQEAHGGDATDDMIGDIEADKGEEGNDENGEEDIEDRVVDLEDAIDDLKAEFEKMMSDKDEGEDDEDSDDKEEKEDEAFVDQSAEGTTEVAPELGDQPAVESKSNTPKTAGEEIREYVNKVSVAHKDGSDNSKSPVAGENDMGGTAKNLVQGGEEKGSKAPTAKEENAGNINVPGGKVKLTAAPKAVTKADDDKSAKSTIGS